MSRSALDRNRAGSHSGSGPSHQITRESRGRKSSHLTGEGGDPSFASPESAAVGSPESRLGPWTPQVSRRSSFAEKVEGVGGREFNPTFPELGGHLPSVREESALPTPLGRRVDSMNTDFLAPGAKMQAADDRDRRRRREDALEMAAKIRSNAERGNREIPPYDFLELIGKGSFGRVYKCIDKKTGDLVAVKITNVDEQDWQKFNEKEAHEDTIPDFKREVSALQQLKDHNVKNVNVIHDAFDMFDQLWIVADYCTGGSVRTLMRPWQNGLRMSGLDEEFIIPIARELAIAIKGIHELNIVHRDIKCANVYITETGDIQLGDFGIVAEIEQGTKNNKRKTVLGTPHYMALEMHEADLKGGGYGVEVDIWAYGCTLYEMATGLPPMFATPQIDIPDKIREAPPRLEDDRYSENLRDLIAFCLTVDAKTRPTIEEVLKHPALANSSRRYPTSKLIDLITKFKVWEHGGGSRTSLWLPTPHDLAAQRTEVDDEDDSSTHLDAFEDWNFSTSEAFDRRISQLPSLDSDDLSFLQAPAGAGLPPSLAPIQTQDLSIAERIKKEHQEATWSRGENALAPIFDRTREKGYQMTPVEAPKPGQATDLPLRNFTSDAPTRESMIEIDLDEADVNTTATSTFALHMNNLNLNQDTIKPASRRTAPEDDDDDDNYTYGQFNDAADKRATMEWSFPKASQPAQPAQPKRGTMDWTFSTAEPAQPDEPEFSMDLPPVGNDGELATGFRPGLRHTSTEPVGHFRDFSHDMRSAVVSPDRSSVTSMIDLDAGLADPIPRMHDPSDIPRPMTASSTAGSTMTDMTGPFDLEDDPIQREIDRNRFSLHKQWQSDGGTMKRLSHKTMQMHTRGSSLSSTDSETAMHQNDYHTQTSQMDFDIGHGLDFSDDTNQFPNFDSFPTGQGYNNDVPRLGEPEFPLGPALHPHTNGMSSRSRDPSSEPTGPEVEFPMIEAPHPDALAENADPQLLADEMSRFLNDVESSLGSVNQALTRYANINDEEEENFNSDVDAGFESNREGTEYDSSSDYPSTRRARPRQQTDVRSSPRLPLNESFP